MANYKRKKSRKDVKCVNCTDGRQGNSMSYGTGRSSKVLISKLLSRLALKEFEASEQIDRKLARTRSNFDREDED